VNAHIRPYFGKTRAERVTSEQLMEYRIKRQDAGAAPSTVNRELTHLRNALRTAAHDTPPLIPLACIPRFTMVSELGRARQGFLEDDGFAKLIVEMPMYLVPLVTVAYNTGIRQGELLKIQWDQVDFDAQLLRLKSGETKAGPGRSAPFIGIMEDVLVQAKKERDEFWPECKYVFSRLGERIREPKGAWGAAVIRAGMPDLLFHDLRRSGVRNLVRAGVPEAVAMKISGHKTRSVFDRYDITSGQDLADAAAKVKAYRALKNSSTVPATDTKTDTEPKKGGSQ
jgi:integrase